MHRLLSTVVLGAALGVVCLAQTPAGQTPAAAPPPARSVIIGTVVDESSGKAISGVVVTISPGLGTAARRDTTQVLTGADGRFLFASLIEGAYMINARKGGYLPATPGASTGNAGTFVDVAEGQIRSDVKIAMAKPGAITGTVTDENGDPVIGVTVTVSKRARSRGRTIWQPGGNSTKGTDDRGMYRIPDLTPGEYIVMAEQSLVNVPTAMLEAYSKAQDAARPGQPNPLMDEMMATGGMGISTPGTPSARVINSQVQSLSRSSIVPALDDSGRSFVYPTIYYPASTTASKATVLSIKSGEERSSIDLVLRPVRAVSISGTVIGPEGPAALTAVVLSNSDGVEATFNSARIATTTDASGAFTFLGVPAGDYVLRVTKVPPVNVASTMVSNSITSADGSTSFMSTSVGPTKVPPLPPDATLWAEVPVSAGARDLTGLTVTLQRGARLSGRVEFGGASARPTPQQMTSISLSLQPVIAGSRVLRNPRTRIDEQGELTTQGFPAGDYSVNVFGAPAGWFLQSVTSKGVDVTQQPLEIGAADINDIVISFTDKSTEISGTVTARDGSIPKAAVVVLFPSDEPLEHDYGLNSRRVVALRPTANGRFTFKTVPPGAYRVVAVDDVSIMTDLTAAALQPLIARATDVRVAAGEKRQQNLTLVTMK
jgi:hypothetical protein